MMSASPSLKWDRCEPIKLALRCAGSILRFTFVALTLTLLTLAMPEKAQACSGEHNDGRSYIVHSAAQFSVKQPAVPSVVKVTVGSTDDREPPNCSHHVAGIDCCAGTDCCSVCTSASMVASWTVAQRIILYGDWPPLETRSSATGSRTQFRPPRVIS